VHCYGRCGPGYGPEKLCVWSGKRALSVFLPRSYPSFRHPHHLLLSSAACCLSASIQFHSSLRAQVGTAGQRCTTLRRLYVHEKVYDQFVPQLVKAYGSVPIGNPLLPGTLMGPLHNAAAVKVFVDTVAAAKAQGGKVET
jgi:hypothetical protein